MKNKNDEMDIILKRALRSTEKPDSQLMKRVKDKLKKEETVMNKTNIAKHTLRTAAAVIALLLVTATAFAAWRLLKPGQAVEKTGDQTLAAAFEGDTAVNINKTVTSGNYKFTMLAIVSGKDLTSQPYYSSDVEDERTYAVVAIENADGTPMPGHSDKNADEPSFFVSPMVKGLKPWKVNIMTMNGAYTETVADGVLYRIIECDNVAVFADRGLYIGICTNAFYDSDAFVYDGETGKIKANKNYNGSSVVFDLPIDKSFADEEKAEKYLDNLFGRPEEDAESEPVSDQSWEEVDWDKAVEVPSTVKELTVDEENGLTFTYDWEYGSGTIAVLFDDCFKGDERPQSQIVHMMRDDTAVYAVRFSIDEKGAITGAVVVPE